MTQRLPHGDHYLDKIAPTPLVAVQLAPSDPIVWCKLEFLNPSGSTKDRIANYILSRAWRSGAIDAGSTVVEASSGSTSIAMAMACAQLGVRFIAVMPEGVSNERVLIIRAYGGEVRFSPKTEGIRGAIDAAGQLVADSGAFCPRQFENPDNAEAHRVGTAREILADIPGGFADVVVSGVGTGGTLVGLYRGLADGGCDVTPVLARPVTTGDGGCFAEAECCSFSARIPGVADDISKIFRPDELPSLIEVEVEDELAVRTSQDLIRRGFPVGLSSGLNYVAAVEAARRLGGSPTIVTVFPDRMERYFSTDLFKE